MKKPAQIFYDLIVWQKAHEFTLLVYKFTRLFPKEKIYTLTSQLRRSSISIPANIAKGFKKEVSKLLEAYSSSILNPGFCLLYTA